MTVMVRVRRPYLVSVGVCSVPGTPARRESEVEPIRRGVRVSVLPFRGLGGRDSCETKPIWESGRLEVGSGKETERSGILRAPPGFGSGLSCQTKPIGRSGGHRVSRGLEPKSPFCTNEANWASGDARPTGAVVPKRSQFVPRPGPLCREPIGPSLRLKRYSERSETKPIGRASRPSLQPAQGAAVQNKANFRATGIAM